MQHANWNGEYEWHVFGFSESLFSRYYLRVHWILCLVFVMLEAWAKRPVMPWEWLVFTAVSVCPVYPPAFSSSLPQRGLLPLSRQGIAARVLGSWMETSAQFPWDHDGFLGIDHVDCPSVQPLRRANLQSSVLLGTGAAAQLQWWGDDWLLSINFKPIRCFQVHLFWDTRDVPFPSLSGDQIYKPAFPEARPSQTLAFFCLLSVSIWFRPF